MNRAKFHADTLYSEIDAWFEKHPYGVYGEYEPGPPEEYVFKVRFLEHVPATWSVLLGDFAHNARSALDHLAYLIVLDNNGGKDEWTQFPICVAPWEWASQQKKCIGNASERHKAIIETFQPYQRRDLYGFYSIWGAIEDPFAILNRISNIDKHIVLNPTPAVIRSIGYDIESVNDIDSVGNMDIRTEALVDGGDLIRVGIVSNGPAPELKIDRHETLEIRIQYRVELGKDAYTIINVPLKDSLDEILVRLGRILQIFVSEFR